MSEHAEQVLVMRWAELHRARWPELELLHAVPNMGTASKRHTARLKAEGLKSGVPDLHLPVPRCGCASLYIEMKRERLVPGRRGVRRERTYPTRAQRAWHERLREAGNAVEVCWSAEEAQAVIEAYLAGEYRPQSVTRDITTGV